MFCWGKENAQHTPLLSSRPEVARTRCEPAESLLCNNTVFVQGGSATHPLKELYVVPKAETAVPQSKRNAENNNPMILRRLNFVKLLVLFQKYKV